MYDLSLIHIYQHDQRGRVHILGEYLLCAAAKRSAASKDPEQYKRDCAGSQRVFQSAGHASAYVSEAGFFRVFLGARRYNRRIGDRSQVIAKDSAGYDGARQRGRIASQDVYKRQASSLSRKM